MSPKCGVVICEIAKILPKFGRLRLQVAKVPEPTPAPVPTFLGRLRLPAPTYKKISSGSRAALKVAAPAPQH